MESLLCALKMKRSLRGSDSKKSTGLKEQGRAGKLLRENLPPNSLSRVHLRRSPLSSCSSVCFWTVWVSLSHLMLYKRHRIPVIGNKNPKNISILEGAHREHSERGGPSHKKTKSLVYHIQDGPIRFLHPFRLKEC